MRRLAAAAAFVMASLPARAGVWGPNNYLECLLDRLPGTANDAAAAQIMQSCRAEFPGTTTLAKRRGFFDPSAQECVLKNGRSTGSNLAGKAIAYACNTLFQRTEKGD